MKMRENVRWRLQFQLAKLLWLLSGKRYLKDNARKVRGAWKTFWWVGQSNVGQSRLNLWERKKNRIHKIWNISVSERVRQGHPKKIKIFLICKIHWNNLANIFSSKPRSNSCLSRNTLSWIANDDNCRLLESLISHTQTIKLFVIKTNKWNKYFSGMENFRISHWSHIRRFPDKFGFVFDCPCANDRAATRAISSTFYYVAQWWTSFLELNVYHNHIIDIDVHVCTQQWAESDESMRTNLSVFWLAAENVKDTTSVTSPWGCLCPPSTLLIW